MTQEISLFRNFGLATPANVTFSESLNALVGAAYTSTAGNTYLNALRMADGLLIKEDIGHGYAYSFLNGLHIYDLRTRTLICEEFFHCNYYSRDNSKNTAVTMLIDIIMEAARKDHIWIDEQDVKRKVREMVNRAYFGDQMQEIQKTFKQLSA